MGTEFPPLIVRTAYKPDGSAKSAFLAEVDAMGREAKQHFQASSAEIEKVLSRALTSATASAHFDLPGMRQAAADADHALQRLTAMRDAAARLAVQTGDTSSETAKYSQALQAQVREGERAKQIADAQVLTYTRMQAEIDRTIASQERLTQSYRDTFLEQARAENYAHRFQQGVNEVFASGLTSRATDNGAGFAALAAAERYADQANAMRQALDPAYAAQARFNSEMAEARTLIAAGAITLDEYCAKLRLERGLLDMASTAGQRHAATSGAQRVGMQQLSMQIGDMATMYALGANGAQIFASQAGQVIQAVSLMSGGTSKFAKFMMGPWGAALTVGALVLTPFIGKLFESDNALKAAAMASDGLSGAQSVLGQMFDLTTGKIAHQNDLLRLNIQLTEMNLRAEAMQAKSRADAAAIRAGRPDLLTSVGEMLAQGSGAAPIPTDKAPKTIARAMLEDVSSGKVQGSDAMRWAQKADFSSSGISREDFIAGLTAAVEARAKGQTADEIEKTLSSGVLSKMFMRDGTKTRTSKGDDLGAWAESTSEKIARITAQFDEQPKAIDRAAQATRELDMIAADLMKRQPTGFREMVADVGSAKSLIADSLVRPFEDLEKQSQRRVQVQSLLTSGYDAEGTALQQIWQIEDKLGSEEDVRAHIAKLIAEGRKDEADVLQKLVQQYPKLKQEALERAQAEDRVTEALRRQQEIQTAYLNATRSVRQEIEGIFAGEGSFSNVGQIFKRLNAQVVTEQLFGSMFRDIDAWMKRNTGIPDANDMFIRETKRAGSALFDLTANIGRAHANLFGSSIASRAVGANDNPDERLALAQLRSYFDTTLGMGKTGDAAGDIMVQSRTEPQGEAKVALPRDTVGGMSPDLYVRMLSRGIGDVLGEGLSSLLGPQLAQAVGNIAGGAFYGNMIGGAPGAILGSVHQLAGALGLRGLDYKSLGDMVSGTGTGSLVAGLASSLGLGLSNTGSQIGGAIGSVIPGVGSVIGAVAGGLLGKLFGSPKWSTAVASNGGASGAGNQSDWNSATTGAAGSINSAIQKLAEQFGATIGGYNVSIGLNDGNWHVSTTGRSGRLRGNQGWADVTDYGKDEQAALSAAIRDAISDGALQGLRAATTRLLSGGSDIDAQTQKALDFEGVFTSLKQRTDPVGAALDTLDKQFEHLKSVFDEAGASAAEYADLEKLYGIERAEVLKEQQEKLLGSLKSLYSDLTIGDTGLSLRDRLASARAEYDPLAARVKAGDTTAFGDYTDAAKTVLDLTRQIEGSGRAYFDVYDEIKALTKSTIDSQQAAFDATSGRDSPFSKSSVPTTDNASVVSAIAAQTDALLSGLGPKLDALNDNFGTLIEQNKATGTTGSAPISFSSYF